MVVGDGVSKARGWIGHVRSWVVGSFALSLCLSRLPFYLLFEGCLHCRTFPCSIFSTFLPRCDYGQSVVYSAYPTLRALKRKRTGSGNPRRCKVCDDSSHKQVTSALTTHLCVVFAAPNTDIRSTASERLVIVVATSGSQDGIKSSFPFTFTSVFNVIRCC